MNTTLAEDYDQAWADLNSQLKQREQSSGLLETALSKLESQQTQAGFIKDDLNQISRHVYVKQEYPHCYIRVQYNPRRALRFHGSGVSSPPPGMSSVNNGCFLCRENVQWQQQGKEIGYEINVSDSQYIAWMNPFPLLPCHVVISTREHVSQEWELHPEGSLSLEQLVNSLVQLGLRLPGFIGFYNGINAGASIPGHMHYQFCKRPDKHEHFPLELAERKYLEDGHTAVLQHYPLEVAVWEGDAATVTKQCIDWIRNWALGNKNNIHNLTANFIVAVDGDTGNVSLYFAPRDRNRCKSKMMSGLIGGLEVLGELVFSTEEEYVAIDQNQLSYHSLLEIYGDIYTPFFPENDSQ